MKATMRLSVSDALGLLSAPLWRSAVELAGAAAGLVTSLEMRWRLARRRPIRVAPRPRSHSVASHPEPIASRR